MGDDDPRLLPQAPGRASRGRRPRPALPRPRRVRGGTPPRAGGARGDPGARGRRLGGRRADGCELSGLARGEDHPDRARAPSQPGNGASAPARGLRADRCLDQEGKGEAAPPPGRARGRDPRARRVRRRAPGDRPPLLRAQGRAVRARLLGPRAPRRRGAGDLRAGARSLARAVPPRHGRRVPGHEPRPAGARRSPPRPPHQALHGRRRAPVHLPVPQCRSRGLPRARARGGRLRIDGRSPPPGQFPLEGADPGRGKHARRRPLWTASTRSPPAIRPSRSWTRQTSSCS